ncbi:hypothetical protein SERLA73DRAFT_177104 [Serpula lacrymans var. lacrymans S7.3]|uniref:tRNA (adenine(58)-N(1))-methyltransferase non-catalytic subunit TRM6 n=2 Tax=Serpula lacrymans var. lacrymans TaxID=341189 RepID=F8PR22_SERL3|nr:uncharacterized protein SERLADRAFT_460539 [Serpula lacrymans var. lacrymans S7.9]EGO01679.1 hypothetical protein SERLA73DRAFT_177104 [Serpula lacrymans var. lacrymans S7.3]EGO27322.1 hypothetical protein SERLADRAFT_460539 [Serpula lacrymans var. lacrymans S7.9]
MFMDSATSPVIKHNDIRDGDTVMLQLLNGEIRSMKVQKDSNITLGRIGSFPGVHLLGQTYGLTYEIVEKELKVIPPRTLQDVEDTDATNELINDDDFVQPMALEEIESWKRAGMHASVGFFLKLPTVDTSENLVFLKDIINRQIEQHANYSLKTAYSKEKYKKRKEAKYLKAFTTVEPTLFNVCTYWFRKNPTRIRDIRPDTLSQIMNMANIRPGGRYIAVDDAAGILVCGILDRMGGQGRLITICDVDCPPAYPTLTQMNFNHEATISILSSLNWATAQPDYISVMAPEPVTEVKSERHRSRLQKRKVVTDAVSNTREELFSGEFDALVISCEFDILQVVEVLSPYLAGSASIVVHSPHIQTLVELQAKLRSLPNFIAPSLTESWLRCYQVLPGRTHPMMNMSGSGGYLLHSIKIYDVAKT